MFNVFTALYKLYLSQTEEDISLISKHTVSWGAHLVGGREEDVAAGEVPVDEALRLEVGHPRGDLDGVLTQHAQQHLTLVLPAQLVEKRSRGS